MRIAFSALLLVHALLHLIGVRRAWSRKAAKEEGRGAIVELTAYGKHVVGVGWLVNAVVLFGAALMVLLGRDDWWYLGALGVLWSQMLIVLHWPIAKAGTVPNVLLALAVVPAAAMAHFHDRTAVQSAELRSSDRPTRVVTTSEVSALPPPIQRWLNAAGVVGRPRATFVTLAQGGQMRTAIDAPFVAVTAAQTFSVAQPGFVWSVDLRMKGVPVVGRDTLRAGHGRMLVKALGLVTVADGQGPTYDEGTLLRFLGEIIWFPSAALEPYITWRALDEHEVEGTLTLNETRVTAIFSIDDHGRVTRLRARRWFDGRSLEAWEIPIFEWRRVRGIEMPTRGSAIWKLAAGDFEYFRWEILDVEASPTG